ncbi:MAG: flagellar filament capping protein FliD [Nitrospirae bacterium]|nr:flagellar filament capping protein FliD [Nitrospirota bacterium]
MSTFSVSGLSSGINANDIITKLMELERRPVTLLQSKQTAYNDKITAYSDFQSKILSLKTAADELRTTSNFFAKKASVSDSTILDASATNSAPAGSYTIASHSTAGKIQLAQSEQKSHTAGTAAINTSVNSSGSDKIFQYTYAGSQSSITVADGTTLEGLRDLINSDSGNPGVNATIIYDGSVYKLALTGNDSGSTKTISIDSGTTLDGTGSTVDLTGSAFTTNQTAQDAKLRINGIDITSSSNNVSGVISGLTLTLKKESTSSATVAVTNDTDSIKKKIEDFVTAYNNAINYAASKSSWDSTTKTGGPLLGDATARDVVRSMKAMVIGTVSAASSDVDSLAGIGITTNSKDGTLTINSTTLSDKLSARIDDVSKLFATATTGIANQIWSYADTITKSTDGALTIRKSGLQSVVNNIASNITSLETRLVKVEDDLRRRFSALESLLNGLTSQGTFLNNQITKWNSQ